MTDHKCAEVDRWIAEYRKASEETVQKLANALAEALRERDEARAALVHLCGPCERFGPEEHCPQCEALKG